jgi:acetyl/propionyl-CoA carboxylase alpha subunit
MDFEFLVNKARHKVSLEKKGKHFVLRHKDGSFEADFQVISANSLSLLVDGRSYLIYIARDKDKKYIYLDGELYIVHKPGDKERCIDREEDRSQKEKSLITAPMPGKVIKINVAEKEAVRKNQTLAIVEAMKMENEIKSPVEGYVKKIFVSAGDMVDSEKPLIELEPE